MNETSRNQGWAIAGGAVFVGLLFLAGILQQSYWALAIPVAVLVFFVLGLVAWVGHTIATVQIEPETFEPEQTESERAELAPGQPEPPRREPAAVPEAPSQSH